MKGDKKQAVDEPTATDAEIAWRLHQELNAISPMLRTRSRKAINRLGTDNAKPSSKPETESSDEEQEAEKLDKPVSPKHTETKKSTMKKLNKGDTTKQTSDALEAIDHMEAAHTDDSKQEQPNKGNRIASDDNKSAEPNGSSAAPQTTKQATRKGRPTIAAEAGEPVKTEGHQHPQKPSKPPKIPKLPMVRQGKKWYRARLIKESEEKALIEFAGYENLFPTCWLPKDSDRIWFGSYKGKDWKYLGDGAWEPKSGVHNKVYSKVAGMKRKSDGEEHSDDVQDNLKKPTALQRTKKEEEPPSKRSRKYNAAHPIRQQRSTRHDTANLLTTHHPKNEGLPQEDTERVITKAEDDRVHDDDVDDQPQNENHHRDVQRREKGHYNKNQARDAEHDDDEDYQHINNYLVHKEDNDDNDDNEHDVDDDNDDKGQNQNQKHDQKQIGKRRPTAAPAGRRRGRPPGSGAHAHKQKKGNSDTIRNLNINDQDEDHAGALDDLIEASGRPRRSTRRAVPFHFDEEEEEEEQQKDDNRGKEMGEYDGMVDVDVGVDGFPGGNPMTHDEGTIIDGLAPHLQHHHRHRSRRKPLVSSPSPTDVEMVALDEFEALDALALMPSPRNDNDGLRHNHNHLKANHHNTSNEHHANRHPGRPPMPRRGRPPGSSYGGLNTHAQRDRHAATMVHHHRRNAKDNGLYNGSGSPHSNRHIQSNSTSRIRSIVTAEQMFGQLLRALAYRVGGEAPPPAPLNEGGWVSLVTGRVPAIVRVDAELLKAVLYNSSSNNSSIAHENTDEDQPHRHAKVPLFF